MANKEQTNHEAHQCRELRKQRDRIWESLGYINAARAHQLNELNKEFDSAEAKAKKRLDEIQARITELNG